MTDLTRRSVNGLLVGAALLTGTGTIGSREAVANTEAMPGTTPADDIAVLRAAMEIHPGALRYLNPAILDAGLSSLSETFEQTDGLASRYLALSKFLATLRCGHTYANFYNQSAPLRSALFDRKTRLPFAFRWIGDLMVVTEASPKLNLPRGSVVTRINRVGAEDMLRSLMPYTRADGSAFVKRKALLEVQHREKFEYFDIFHGLVYGEPAGGVHRIEYTDPKGRSRTLDSAPISLAERQEARSAKAATLGNEEPGWTFDERDGIGVLTMADWSTYSKKWDWQSWLDTRLDQAASLRGLIIDNRQNEGGDPKVGAHLLSRLIDKPLRPPSYARLVRFRTLPDSLRSFTKTWDPNFYELGRDAKDLGRGFFQLPEVSDAAQQIQPRGKQVNVPTVLLTSPTNSSATFTFARIAKASGRMRLVGGTTGGNYRGINGDGYFFTTLPHSGIEFDVPIVGKFPLTPQPDAGVSPDLMVKESVADIVKGKDRTMDAAVSLLS